MGVAQVSPWLRALMARVERGEVPTMTTPPPSLSADDLERQRVQRLIDKRLQARGAREFLRLSRDPSTTGEIWQKVKAMTRSSDWLTRRPSFLLSGPRGCGKTTALCGIGVRAIQAKRSVWYLPITGLARVIKAAEEDYLNMTALHSCELLLLDELHRFSDLPGWIRSELVGLIDHRYGEFRRSGNIRQTGAAGTLPPDALADVMGREIVERFDRRICSTDSSFRHEGVI